MVPLHTANDWAAVDDSQLDHLTFSRWSDKDSNSRIERMITKQYKFDDERRKAEESKLHLACSNSVSVDDGNYPTTFRYLKSDESDQLPSLVHSTDTVSDSSTVAIMEKSELKVQGISQSVQPPPTVFQCPFWFLSCSYTTSESSEWKSHINIHFRGHNPPNSLTCSHCCEIGVSGGPAFNWDSLMDHIAAHCSSGLILKGKRASFPLMQYLWQKHIISYTELQELCAGRCLESSDHTYSTAHSATLDKRR